jgi:beta-glucosidase
MELKGFKKIYLKPGETKTVDFMISSEHISFLNRDLKCIVEPGTFKVMVGGSSDDIRLSGDFEVEEKKKAS